MALGPERYALAAGAATMLVAALPLRSPCASAARRQQRGDHPLLPPRLLQLTSIRFGWPSPCCFSAPGPALCSAWR